MKSIITAIALTGTLVASAEVKPKGTILDEYCGHLNRSVSVCESHVQGAKQKYISVRHFLRSKTYVRVTQIIVAEDGGPTLLKGHGVAPDSQFPKYDVEREYKLMLTKNGDGSKTGTLYVNGKQQGPTIRMPEVVSTQDIE